MGGGSADAAATLVACDAMWGTDCRRKSCTRSRRSSAPTCRSPSTGGTAIGTGRGDRLSPALATGSFHWVLAVAEFGLSTPGVYRELDRRRGRACDLARSTAPPTVDATVLQALRAGDPRLLADALHNDLQAAALGLAPGLGGILELGESHGALAGIVSGSGPTVAFLVDDADTALELQVALSAARLNARARARSGARRPHACTDARVPPSPPGPATNRVATPRQVGLPDMAHLLGAERLHLEFPTRTVFDEVTLGIDEGDRIGVVGRNGDGKSTLLKLLAGRLEPDGGRVTPRGGIRIGMLDQSDDVDPGMTVAEAVVGGIEEHVWAGDARVRDVIAGLLADVPWHAQVASLSAASAAASASPRCSSATGTWCSSTSPPTTSTSRASPGSPGT